MRYQVLRVHEPRGGLPRDAGMAKGFVEDGHYYGRALLSSFMSAPGTPWLLIGVCVGALVLIAIVILCVRTNCCQPAKVGDDLARSRRRPGKNSVFSVGSTPEKPVPTKDLPPGPPPGFILDPKVADIKPYQSNPRTGRQSPYQRLVLLSSRVRAPFEAVQGVHKDTAIVVYDWKSSTLNDLLNSVKAVVQHSASGSTVKSIAVIAPSSKGGAIGLLDGKRTTVAKLERDVELLQFWKALAGCVRQDAAGEGGRIDLLGCRLLEKQTAAANLLKLLWAETGVPFAASDDPIQGYPLSTFTEAPDTGATTLVSTVDLRALDLYFDSDAMEQIWGDPGVSRPPPEHVMGATNRSLPEFPAASAGLSAAASPAQARVPLQYEGSLHDAGPGVMDVLDQPQSRPGPDIFTAFLEALDRSNKQFKDECESYEEMNVKIIAPDMLLALLHKHVPDMTARDSAHVMAYLTLSDWRNGAEATDLQRMFKEAADLHEDMRRLIGKDTSIAAQRKNKDIIATYREYFSNPAHRQEIEHLFQKLDKNRTGRLEATEVYQFVKSIPNSQSEDHKRILVYLYERDLNMDGMLSSEEFINAFAS